MTKPLEDRVTPKAGAAYKALLCIDYAARDFMEMHPETLRDKLPMLRRILSILNGIGKMSVASWGKRSMRYRAGISDVAVAFRTAVHISDTCKDLDEVPPEVIERSVRRLKFILFLMNRIGRDGWLAWKDYDLSVTAGMSGISSCNSRGSVHTINESQLPLFVD